MQTYSGFFLFIFQRFFACKCNTQSRRKINVIFAIEFASIIALMGNLDVFAQRQEFFVIHPLSKYTVEDKETILRMQDTW